MEHHKRRTAEEKKVTMPSLLHIQQSNLQEEQQRHSEATNASTASSSLLFPQIPTTILYSPSPLREISDYFSLPTSTTNTPQLALSSASTTQQSAVAATTTTPSLPAPQPIPQRPQKINLPTSQLAYSFSASPSSYQNFFPPHLRTPPLLPRSPSAESLEEDSTSSSPSTPAILKRKNRPLEPINTSKPLRTSSNMMHSELPPSPLTTFTPSMANDATIASVYSSKARLHPTLKLSSSVNPSPRTYHSALSQQQIAFQMQQRELIQQATRAAMLGGPVSPRLIPLGSPGPVTPFMLEESNGGYVMASGSAPPMLQFEPHHLEKLAKAAAASVAPEFSDENNANLS